MAYFGAVTLAVPVLVLAVIQGSSGDGKVPVELTQKCEKYTNLPQINQKVLTFVANGDWKQLRRDLSALLDDNSEEYRQLQETKDRLSTVGYKGHIQLATLLLCAGLPADTPSDRLDNTMLHGAALWGHLQLVKMLLDSGATVDVISKHGDTTPLILAAYNGNLDVVKLLVQAGADTALGDRSGDTALYWATARGKTEVAKYLETLPH